MGQTLSIENTTDSPIRVEWWTAGWGFKVADYTIGARQERAVKKEAVWYEIKIVEQNGRFIDRKFYGGAHANWRWDGQTLKT
jgi:hypothetical protein